MSVQSNDELVRVGHVAGAHGIRGDVLIKSYTDVPEDIGSYGPLRTQRDATLNILSCRASSKGVVARLKGVTSRNAAEALKGSELYIPRDRLPETDDEEWYIADLIGLAVRDPGGTAIGSVVTVHDFGAGELVEIKLDDRPQTVLVPFTEEVVPVVQVAEGFIAVELTPHLVGEGDDAPPPEAPK